MEVNLDEYARMMNSKCNNEHDKLFHAWYASDLKDAKRSYCRRYYFDSDYGKLCGQCESSLIQLKFMQQLNNAVIESRAELKYLREQIDLIKSKN